MLLRYANIQSFGTTINPAGLQTRHPEVSPRKLLEKSGLQMSVGAPFWKVLVSFSKANRAQRWHLLDPVP